MSDGKPKEGTMEYEWYLQEQASPPTGLRLRLREAFAKSKQAPALSDKKQPVTTDGGRESLRLRKWRESSERGI